MSRIEQFQKMVQADPENELGHFSLGQAYVEARQYREAIPPLERVIELNPRNSKAYALLAQAQMAAGDSGGALATLRQGWDVAYARGDRAPQAEIETMMRQLGETPPAVEPVAVAAPGAAAPTATSAQQVQCRRCGQVRPKMAERPFKGPLGERVWGNVCAACWQEWIRMGTKVINEMRLNFADPQHGEVYDQYMKQFLNLES